MFLSRKVLGVSLLLAGSGVVYTAHESKKRNQKLLMQTQDPPVVKT